MNPGSVHTHMTLWFIVHYHSNFINGRVGKEFYQHTQLSHTPYINSPTFHPMCK